MNKLLLLFIIICQCSFAQNGFNKYPCDLTIGTASFLNKTSLTIDNVGNKWIGFKRLTTGSALSLLKFDGSTWTNYTANINAPVLALETDATGNVWIGTLNAGLIKYDGSTFTSFTRANSGIISDTIISLSFINGKLYIGSYTGFSEYNTSTFVNYSRSNSGLSSDSTFCFKQENTQIWIGTHKGLNNYNGTNAINYVGSTDTINAIEIDASGNKWLGTNSFGLVKYNNTAFINSSTLIPSIFGGYMPAKIMSLTTSATGNIIVNTERKISSLFTTTKNALMEIFPDNTYKLFFHPYGRLNGSCYFKKDAAGIIYYIDHKIQSSSSPALFNTKTFLYSFDATQFDAAAQISTITPENTQFLDINEVKAGCNPNADIHWDGSGNLYEVPKGSGSSPNSTTKLWIGGYVNGQLRMGAATYRQNGSDFWPGTLHFATGLADSTNAKYYNRVWKVSRFEIENFKFNYLNGNVQNGSYTIPDVILNWPWMNMNSIDPLAPFFDYNNDSWYDPMDGDYPLIKGDQMLWWVFNDQLSAHTESGSVAPMGIQIMASAYAYTCPNVADTDKVINYTTFYNYRIVNKSTDVIDSMYIGVTSEVDLGFYNDDYIGCDVQNNFSYVHNGDNFDQDGFFPGYHSNTPFFSYNVLKGPIADQGDGIDNDKDGCIDCSFPINPVTGEPDPGLGTLDEFTKPEHTSMTNFKGYNNTAAANVGNPTSTGNGIEYYRYISGIWKNGTTMNYPAGGSGTGTQASGPPCSYLFPGSSDPLGYGVGGGPGNPQTQPTWTEVTSATAPGDRRMLTGTGKFTLQPNQIKELDFAYVFTQDSVALANGTLYDKVVSDNKKVKKWFRDNNAPSCLDLTGIGLKEQTNQIKINLYPNPANNVLNVDAGNNNTITGIKVMDILGKAILNQKVNRSTEQLTISSFQSGVYLIQVTTEKGMYFGKFIKQ